MYSEQARKLSNVIEEAGHTEQEAAARLGTTTKEVRRFLNGVAPIKRRMALRIQEQYKVPADTWLSLNKETTNA